jgi:ligand-binding SRPBCC domain-containing protein
LFVASQRLSAPEAVWDFHRRTELFLRAWPDGVVVFDDSNAELQCLTPASGAVLEVLEERSPCTSQQVAIEIFGDDTSSADVEMIENVLVEFLSLNFIERILI